MTLVDFSRHRQTAEIRRAVKVRRVLQKHDERVECEASLIAFMERAWQEIESGAFSLNWHHIEIARVLEDVTFGYERNAVFNIPPRCTKSLEVNVLWPAWIWAQPEDKWGSLVGPRVRFLCVSFASRLSERLALKMKTLVMGAWYQSLWGHQISIRPDQKSRSDFANTLGGERISMSVEAGLLGSGGDIQICFPYDELNLTEFGYIPIGEIVDRKYNLRVWSISASGNIELQPITGWHRNPGARIIKLGFDGGDDVRCTADHRLLAGSGWREAWSLSVGDSVWTAGIDEIALHQRDSFRADVIEFGEGSVALGADANVADLIASKFGFGVVGAARSVVGTNLLLSGSLDADRSSVRLVDGADEFPFTSPSNLPDSSYSDVVSLGKRTCGFGSLQDFDDLYFSEFGESMSFADSEMTMLELVGDVFPASSISETGQPGFGFAAVNVADFLTGRWRPQKSQGDEAVDFDAAALSVTEEFNGRISFVVDGVGKQSVADMATDCIFARQAIHATEIGNLVPRESGNGKPRLARIVSITDLGHAPITYCLTVGRNGTMICGSAQAIAANCDDPHSVGQAESELERASTLDAMRQLTTRVTDPRISARVLIMQRLHEDDATNYALENWGTRAHPVKHLMFPMRFDITRAIPEDPRVEDGELLWPEVWTEEAVQKEEKELQEYGVAGQLQQSPIPRGGGIIKSEWWRLWPDDAPEAGTAHNFYRCTVCKWIGAFNWDGPTVDCQACGSLAERQVMFPPFSYRLVSVDTAYGEKEENSFSAATSWGIWHDKDEAPRLMLTEAWRGRPRLYGDSHANPPTKGLIEQIYDMATRPNRLADAIIIEKKTRGVDLYNELERVASEWPFQLIYFDPTGRGDKIARLHACVGAFTNELIWAPGKNWARTVIEETSSQPRAQYSDLSDTVSMLIQHCRDAGLIMHMEEHRREVFRAKLFRGRVTSAAEMIEGA